MEVVAHPYLKGVLCRSDGAVYVPSCGVGPSSHWTFGTAVKGYRRIRVQGKIHLVHRLICEAFNGVCPSDKSQIDHINRDKADNRPENLRWVTPSENCQNRGTCTEAMKGVVSQRVDPVGYQLSWLANNPEKHERRKAYMREYARERRKRKGNTK